MGYGRPFGTFKPTDWGYDNFRDKVNDSRYYKTFSYEYLSNMPLASSTSYTWTTAAATWWNANKPASQPIVKAGDKRILNGQRALIYLENERDEALDSTMVMSMPFQFMVRWIRSATTGRYYYRLWHNGTNMGLANPMTSPYLSSKKYVDPLRGGSSDEANFNSESGTRDAILMRLAETYLIRAEAYGRKGNYALAVADINVLRDRAAYKSGESRPNVLVEWEPKAVSLTLPEKTPPYVAVNSYSKIMVNENYFSPGTQEANRERYIPTVTTKADMFIHFIYNEKAREFISEGLQWEDLHNAGILYERVVYLNQMASDRPGLWPVATNTASGNGQDGNGKGQMKKHYTFRPWPNAYLVQLTDESGKPINAAARAAYQNPGY
ncbi:MAG: RagB/SusD family nutrient uptake outer membrane protein [Segetibacter sp.]|nr:RagB/SusD family nutrient uptake outer membrane protein [Segetibacter sp.]